MPITKRQFDWGVDGEIEAWMDKIKQYLKENKDKAFTAYELMEIFHGKAAWGISEKDAFNEAIEKLEEEESIEKKKIREDIYYILL